MTGHANPQRLVDAAVGVRKLDVEYVDSVAECHKLFATGRYAGMPASRYSARCQGVRRCASRLSGRLSDSQIAKRRLPLRLVRARIAQRVGTYAANPGNRCANIRPACHCHPPPPELLRAGQSSRWSALVEVLHGHECLDALVGILESRYEQLGSVVDAIRHNERFLIGLDGVVLVQ